MKYFTLFFLLSISFLMAQEIPDTIMLEQAEATGKRKQPKSLQYTEMTKMPDFGVYSFGFDVINGFVYVMSGDVSDSNYKGFNDEIYIYDIENDLWKTSKAKSSKVANNIVIGYNNLLYNFGGRKLGKNKLRELLNDKIDVYDIENDTVITVGNMPHQAVDFAAVKVNDHILFFGGSTKITVTNQKIYSDKIHLLDLTTGN